MCRRFLVLLVVLLALPASALADADTGGASPPSGSGGAEFGAPQPVAKPAKRRPLVATRFSISPSTVVLGTTARVAYRVNGSPRRVRVRVDLVRSGGRTVALRKRLGFKHTNETHSSTWTLAADA